MRFNKNRSGVKRLLASVLILAMLLTLLPTSAFAARQNSLLGWLFSSLTGGGQKADPTPAPAPVVEEPVAVEPPAEEPAPEEPAPEPPPVEEPVAEAPAEEPAEPAAEAPAEAPAEEPAVSPAIAEELKVEDLTVTIDAEAGAFPEGAEVQAEKVDIADVQKAVDAADDVSGTVLVAVDITFTKDGAELQPADGKAVKVNISAPALDGKAEEATVVHIDSDTKEAEEIDTLDAPADDEVAFEAEKFSVYAVLADGSTDPDARRMVRFFLSEGSDPIATMYVRAADPEAEREKIVYDPGVGTLPEGRVFRGWTTDPNYGVDTEILDIAGVREAVYDEEENPFVEGDEETYMDFYAAIFYAYKIYYLDEFDTTLESDIAYAADESGAVYSIDLKYASPDPNAGFLGWDVVSGNPVADVEPPYPVGTEVTITEDLTLQAVAPRGNWLIFNENGAGASYTAPQFIVNKEDDDDGFTYQRVTEEPAKEPTRHGYQFIGWFENPEGTGDPFEFGYPITERTELYAKWEENTEAGYAIIVWKQRMSDTFAEVQAGAEKQYDFAYAMTGEDQVGQRLIADLGLVTQDGASVTDYDLVSYRNVKVGGVEQSFLGYHFARMDEDVAIVPDGSAVLNIYYDRNIVTYTFNTWQNTTTYSYSPTTSNTGTQYGLVNGEYIQLVRDQRDEYTPTTSNDGDQYGLVDGEYVRIYRGAISGTWYVGVVLIGDVYRGTRYLKETIYTYTANGEPYTGTRFTRSSRSGNQWAPYQEEIGYYGEKLNWPTNQNLAWYESGGSNGNATGTRMTYKADFLPLDSDMNVVYYGESISGTGAIRFWTQNADGTYTQQMSVRTSSGNGSFSINDKFSGYRAAHYRSNNSNDWTDIDPSTLNESTGIYGSAVSYRNTLDIYYDRKLFDIVFKDGSYFSGQNGQNRDDVGAYTGVFQVNGEDAATEFYGSDISGYASFDPGEPYNEGYTFVGWYADKTCTQPYPFTTMPDGGVTVYAKWVKNQYRVFLHPNADGDDSLDWGGNQAMNFRVDYLGTVQDVTGTRDKFEFMGWYKDESLHDPFNIETKLTDDITADYDKTTEMTDVMDKFGNIVDESTAFNADADRAWVNRKLDLYGKWRAATIGAAGINVVYVDGETETEDPLVYKDASTAFAMTAPDADPESNEQFLYWIIQTWDEDEGAFVDTNKHVYPGDIFDILLDDARPEELEGSTEDDPKFKYTIQLRSAYTKKQVPTDTHIDWYGNGGTTANNEEVVKDEGLQINEKVAIRPADTFSRYGFDFIGWAKLDEGEEPSDDMEPWLYYVDGAFYLDPEDEESHVTHVAADEVQPYQDLYAVWEALPTYNVYWNSNIQEKSGVALDTDKFENLPDDAVLADLGWKIADEEVLIIENVTIPAPDTFQYPDATFLGWGKVDSENPVIPTEPWLSWDGSAYRLAGDIVTEISADDIQPDENLVAIWEGKFYVEYYVAHHDPEQQPEYASIEYTIPFSALDNGKYNIIDGTEEYPGVDEAKYLYAGYQMLSDENTRPYCSEDGYSMTPELGKHYYVKQVPVADKYLNPFLRYLYRLSPGYNNCVTDMWILSSVDDLEYSDTGFIINETQETATGIRTKVTILNNKGEAVTITRQNAFVGPENLPLDGYMTYYTFPAAKITANTTYDVVPFWVTYDGVMVQGRVNRVIQLDENCAINS